jgi:2'-5' RNA ligase
MARLFFALWPDQDAAQELAALSQAIASRAGGRAVPAPKLHLTLVFLGEVEARRVASLHQAAGRIAVRPFSLAFDQVGCFARAGVAWAGCRRPPLELLELQSSLQRELAAERFAPEARPFVPHLTLARRIAKPVAAEPITPVSWLAKAFALVESGGARAGYATLAQWPLAEMTTKAPPVPGQRAGSAITEGN